MTTTETKTTLTNTPNLCGSDPQKFDRRKNWPLWHKTEASLYAIRAGHIFLSFPNIEKSYKPGIAIRLCKIPTWIHHNEIDYIVNHKKLNEIAYELLTLDEKLMWNKTPSADIQKRYDDLYTEANSIVSEIINKLNNKCLLPRNFLEKDICEYLEKNCEKYKTSLEFAEAFVCDLLAAEPFHWYAHYANYDNIYSTIIPLTPNNIIYEAQKVWQQKFQS